MSGAVPTWRCLCGAEYELTVDLDRAPVFLRRVGWGRRVLKRCYRCRRPLRETRAATATGVQLVLDEGRS